MSRHQRFRLIRLMYIVLTPFLIFWIISVYSKKKKKIFKQFKKVNYIVDYFTFPYLMDIVLVIPEDSIILDLGTGHGLVLIKFASRFSIEIRDDTFSVFFTVKIS